MTESEWLACKVPTEMVRFVSAQQGMVRRKAGRRKLRLFGVACCRNLGTLMTDPRSVAAVEVAERLADGQATPEEVQLARMEAFWAYEDQFKKRRTTADDEFQAAVAAVRVLDEHAVHFGRAGNRWSGPQPNEPGYQHHQERCRWQADMLRCIFGYLFGDHILPPGWKKWSDGTLPRLAWSIYDERAFDRLPILADALEDAGCSDPALLDHLRGPGPHVRGCWPLDLLLAKS